MPTVHTTPEYEKCRERLLTRGKIGKDAYDKVRVADAEAGQGGIRTVPRTHRGEDRIPDAEKYDLPGDYRLVVQRVGGPEVARLFLFVGSHDEAERWLENHRGRRWPLDPRGRAKPDPEKVRLQQDLKKREVEHQQLAGQVGALKQENDQLGEQLLAREGEVERLAAQVRELEGRQSRIEAERQEAARERELLRGRQHELAGRAAPSGDSHRGQEAERLAAQVRELAEREARIEADRRQLARQRDQLADRHQQLAADAARLQAELHDRTGQLTRVSDRISRLEQENRSLRRRLDRGAAAGPRVSPSAGRHRRRVWGLPVVATVILVAATGLVLSGFFRPTARRGQEAQPEAQGEGSGGRPPSHAGEPGRPAAPPRDEGGNAIPVAEAGRRVGQVCTVEFVVRSARAGRDGKVVFLNSEASYQNPSNFTVLLGSGVLARGTDEPAVVAQAWIGKRVRARGLVREYKGRYEIRLDSPDQLE